MSNEPKISDPSDPPPAEYENFTKGLKRLLSVPKSEIDKREADWRKQQDAKKSARKPKTN